MFWAGSLILRFIIALLLNTFVLIAIKFSLDRCTPNHGYHIYTMNIKLSESICEPVAGWAGAARAAETKSKNATGGFNQPEKDWVAEMFSSSPSIVTAFGLDSLPLVFIEERTTPRIIKLLLYWLLPPLLIALLAETISSLRSGKMPD